MQVDLTEQEWTLVLNAMALAPYREIQPTIAKMMQQLVAQKEHKEGE